METLKLLLELPLGTLALLVGGYLGYRVAFVGRNRSHSATDTLFRTLAFGLVVKLTYAATAGQMNPTGQALFGLATALAWAAIWRAWAAEAAFQIARRVRLLDHDGHASAWDTLLARGTEGHGSIIAHLKDGTSLMSFGLQRFAGFPLGPCLLGEDGSLGLFVTDVCPKDAKDWTPIKRDGPPTMTFIPAAEIARVEVQWC